MFWWLQVGSCKEYEWFEQLLEQLLKTDDKTAVKAVLDVSQLMVDCLVESLLTLDETSGDLLSPPIPSVFTASPLSSLGPGVSS